MTRKQREERRKLVKKRMMATGICIGILLVVLLLSIAYNQKQKRIEEKEGILELKNILCESNGGTYTKFNYTDYCYGDIAIGLVFVEIKTKCYGENEPCTFELKQVN